MYDLPAHVGKLLVDQEGVDITFNVQGHKIVLAMRSHGRRSSRLSSTGTGRGARITRGASPTLWCSRFCATSCTRTRHSSRTTLTTRTQ